MDSIPKSGNAKGDVHRKANYVEWLTFLLGPVVFVVILVGGFFAGWNQWHGMTFGDYVQGVAAGAGLLAVGHGIHRSSRLGRARNQPTTDD